MKNENDVRNFLKTFDFSFLKARVLREESWSEEFYLEIQEQYRAFIFVCWKHKGFKKIPTENIDRFWHHHILFTKRYHDFCLKIFGYYLHHSPGENHETQ